MYLSQILCLQVVWQPVCSFSKPLKKGICLSHPHPPCFSGWLFICSGLFRMWSLRAAWFFRRHLLCEPRFCQSLASRESFNTDPSFCGYFFPVTSNSPVCQGKENWLLPWLQNNANEREKWPGGVATSQFPCIKESRARVWQNCSSKGTVRVPVWSVIFSVKYNNKNNS